MKKSLVLIATLLIILPLPSSAKMYMWVDENGVKHWSNTPPINNDEVQESAEVESNYQPTEPPPETATPQAAPQQAMPVAHSAGQPVQTVATTSRGAQATIITDELIEAERQLILDAIDDLDNQYWGMRGYKAVWNKKENRRAKAELEKKLKELENTPEVYFRKRDLGTTDQAVVIGGGRP